MHAGRVAVLFGRADVASALAGVYRACVDGSVRRTRRRFQRFDSPSPLSSASCAAVICVAAVSRSVASSAVTRPRPRSARHARRYLRLSLGDELPNAVDVAVESERTRRSSTVRLECRRAEPRRTAHGHDVFVGERDCPVSVVVANDEHDAAARCEQIRSVVASRREPLVVPLGSDDAGRLDTQDIAASPSPERLPSGS